MNHKTWTAAAVAIALAAQTPAVFAKTAHTAENFTVYSKVYAQAFKNLATSPYVQESATQHATINFTLTTLGKHTPSVASQLKTSHDAETDRAQVDDHNTKQPLIWYQSKGTRSSGTYLQIRSKFFSNTGKGWASNNADLGSVSSMLTVRDLPTWASFEKPVVKSTAHGFVISGNVSVTKYFAQVPSEAQAMSLVLPGLTPSQLTQITKHMSEYDTITVEKIGGSYYVTKDVTTGTLTIPPAIMAQWMGASPSALSKYLRAMTETVSAVTTYAYAKTQVTIPTAVAKLMGGTTVTGQVYGTSN